MSSEPQATGKAAELAQLLHQAIERHPENERDALRAAVSALLLSGVPDTPARMVALLFGEVAA